MAPWQSSQDENYDPPYLYGVSGTVRDGSATPPAQQEDSRADEPFWEPWQDLEQPHEEDTIDWGHGWHFQEYGARDRRTRTATANAGASTSCASTQFTGSRFAYSSYFAAVEPCDDCTYCTKCDPFDNDPHLSKEIRLCKHQKASRMRLPQDTGFCTCFDNSGLEGMLFSSHLSLDADECAMPGAWDNHFDWNPVDPDIEPGARNPNPRGSFPMHDGTVVRVGGTGRSNNAIFSQDALDHVVKQLMGQHQNGTAPSPAS